MDVVFGTHNIGSLPVLLERARVQQESQVEILESLDVFPSTLPTRRESPYSAWVSVSVGCNNTCTFCIVPALRGREKDRRPGDVLAEVEALVAEGVLEVTLLGQNVNSYGVEFGDRYAFSKLLRACGTIDGLERVRFTSPHPRDFTADVIEAMAETPNVMPSLHMPLQSGSDRILKAMRRSYRRDRYLKIIEDVRAAMPDAAITTDIIVGFPGETEEDFQGTLDVVRQARFAGAFTFQYSKRPGTPAESMEDQVPRDVVQDRYERLVALQDDMAWDENKKIVGRSLEVLVAEGEGRKDAATHRLSGRARDNRLVHFALPEGVETPRPGDLATVEVTYAAPHHLVADVFGSVRRTRAGDAWERAQDAARLSTPGVMLGMPTIGAKPARTGSRRLPGRVTDQPAAEQPAVRLLPAGRASRSRRGGMRMSTRSTTPGCCGATATGTRCATRPTSCATSRSTTTRSRRCARSTARTWSSSDSTARPSPTRRSPVTSARPRSARSTPTCTAACRRSPPPAVPPGRVVVHGDLHPLNVIATADGPVVIDWRNAEEGTAEFDIAMTAIIFAQVALDPSFEALHPAAARSPRHLPRQLHRPHPRPRRRPGRPRPQRHPHPRGAGPPPRPGSPDPLLPLTRPPPARVLEHRLGASDRS